MLTTILVALGIVQLLRILVSCYRYYQYCHLPVKPRTYGWQPVRRDELRPIANALRRDTKAIELHTETTLKPLVSRGYTICIDGTNRSSYETGDYQTIEEEVMPARDWLLSVIADAKSKDLTLVNNSCIFINYKLRAVFILSVNIEFSGTTITNLQYRRIMAIKFRKSMRLALASLTDSADYNHASEVLEETVSQIKLWMRQIARSSSRLVGELTA